MNIKGLKDRVNRLENLIDILEEGKKLVRNTDFRLSRHQYEHDPEMLAAYDESWAPIREVRNGKQELRSISATIGSLDQLYAPSKRRKKRKTKPKSI